MAVLETSSTSQPEKKTDCNPSTTEVSKRAVVKAHSPRFALSRPSPFLHGRTWGASVTWLGSCKVKHKKLPVELSGCFIKLWSSQMTWPSLLVVTRPPELPCFIYCTTLGQPLSRPGWEVWQDIPPRKFAAPPRNFEWNCLVARICLGMRLQKFHHLPPTETQGGSRENFSHPFGWGRSRFDSDHPWSSLMVQEMGSKIFAQSPL